jgi:hypothetical protein
VQIKRLILRSIKDSRNRLRISYKNNLIDQNNSSEYEYGARNTNLKRKVEKLDRTRYLVSSVEKDGDDEKRR